MQDGNHRSEAFNMKWIRFKDKKPQTREFIAGLRTEFPRAYWMGYYDPDEHKGFPGFTLTHWHPLKNPPKEYDKDED